MLRTFHVPASDLRDGDTVALGNLYPNDTQSVIDTVTEKYVDPTDGRVFLSFKRHINLKGYFSPDFTFTILVDTVPCQVALVEHRSINRHKCSCGWEGDWFSIHMSDVRNAALREGD